MKNALALQRIALFLATIFMAMYFWGNDQPEAAGLIPTPWDKLAHLLWYAVLSSLLLFAIGHRVWTWVLVAILLLLAGLDEWHQFVLQGRSPDINDWIADALGVLAGVAIVWRWGPRQS